MALVELTTEELGVAEDLRLAADGYSTEWEQVLRSVADKLDAAAEAEPTLEELEHAQEAVERVNEGE